MLKLQFSLRKSYRFFSFLFNGFDIDLDTAQCEKYQPMQQNFPQDLLSSHACLCSLEDELKKERTVLLQNYNVGVSTSNRTLYGSFFPMLAKYTELAEQYVMELANFKKLFQTSAQQNNTNAVDSNMNNIPPNQRKFATINNGNYNNANIAINNEAKQPEILQPQPHPINDENDTKLSSLYDENVSETQTQTRIQLQTQPQPQAARGTPHTLRRAAAGRTHGARLCPT